MSDLANKPKSLFDGGRKSISNANSELASGGTATVEADRAVEVCVWLLMFRNP
jgi:hypothetical protein